MNIQLRHITGPRNGPSGLFKNIRTEEDLLKLLHLNPLKAEPYVVHYAPLPPVTVYINEGRLLIDCNCGSGVLVDAVWELGACFCCGAIYSSENLKLPKIGDLRLLDMHMGMRHPRNRNYHPDNESLGQVIFLDGVAR